MLKEGMIPAAPKLAELVIRKGLRNWNGLSLKACVSAQRLSRFLHGAESNDTARALVEALDGEITLDELLQRAERPNGDAA